MKRIDGRVANQLRHVKFTLDYLSHPISSVLAEMGGTKVICSVSIDPKVPPWMRQQNVPGGWVTAEYAMLPASTHTRGQREASRGKQGGRTLEIQRLIGRSLRSVVDLKSIGANTFYVDCDVMDADGGTRCASITGASVALWIAFQRLVEMNKLPVIPMTENLAAISVGVLAGKTILDLNYVEDSKADVDMNVVMTESGRFVEVQGTAEENPFSEKQLGSMLKLARGGIETLSAKQREVIEHC